MFVYVYSWIKRKIGKYDENPGEDYIMGAKMGISTDVYYLNESLGVHVLHNECLTLKQPGCTNQADVIARKIIKNYLELMWNQ